MKRYIAPFILLMAVFLVGWTELVDNFYGKNLDKTTFQSPPDTAVPVYSTATGKWSAIAGGGGGGSDASTVTKGITKLSFPPASASDPIAQGANDPSNNPTVTAANAGNIPVVQTGGGAMTHIDPPAGTDTFLASLGTAVPGAFRLIVATDIDELLTVEQLSDVNITALAANHMLVRNAGNTAWINATASGDLTNVLGAFTIATGAVTGGKILDGTITDTDVAAANKDGAAGTASMRTLGTAAGTAAAGTHATQHQNGGADEVATATPANNAIPKAGGTNKLASGWLSEVLNLADLLDATMTGLANNDILMRIGGAWVNAVSAGDVTWTGSGNTITTTIGANKVTVGKMSASATDKVFGRSTAGAGAGEEITFTATARSIADDTSVSAVRTTIGAVGTVNVQVFTADGTYTPTSGMLYCIVEAVGGGGGGGGSDGTAGNCLFAAGGGAGGRTIVVLTASEVGASKAVDIGAGGGGASAGSGTGTAGSDTTLGTTLVVAKGGSGGTGVSTANIPQGGAGGVAGSETAAATGVLATGERGGNGSNFTFTGAFCSAGNGASGPYGTGGLGGIPSGSAAASGSAGSGFGSGGGGAGSNNTATDQAGGSGAAGIMIITEFLP